jgi:Ti-type conjugative transfer relaxase TraA
MIKRSSGRSVVAAAAYRAGEKIVDELTGVNYDYSRKSDVSKTEIMAPEGSPKWCNDRAALWNNAESAARQWNDQTAREVVIALPKELNFDQRQDLTKDFVKNNFVSHGMIADVAYHGQNGKNPHAHIMLSTRIIEKDGFGLKDRSWNRKGMLIEWRKSLAEISNYHLQKQGLDCRIDNRSLKDIGIPLEANLHLGPQVHAAIAKGDAKSLDVYNDALEIMRRNGDRIISNPSIAVSSLENKFSTFSDYDIAKIANSNSANLEQFQKVRDAIIACKDIVSLTSPERGQAPIYSTINNIAAELKISHNLDKLNERHEHKVSPKNSEAIISNCTLSSSQKEAFEYLMSNSSLNVIQGIAGTGKSFLMARCAEAWSMQGYNVKGGAIAGVAAKGLKEGAISDINPQGIESRTLASWLYNIEKNRYKFGKNDIFILDEAGMVGSKEMLKLSSAISEGGAKLVLLGDQEQAQAIGPGNPMKHAVDRYSSKILTDVIRQKSPEMKEATLHFGRGETQKALRIYDNIGAIKMEHQTKEDAIEKISESFLTKGDELKEKIILAHSNEDVMALNDCTRSKLKSNGKLKGGHDINISNRLGVLNKNFAEKDRIVFLAKDKEMGVENGTFGTITNINKDAMTVKIDGDSDKFACFDYRQFNKFDHGYAVTIHKSQGATKDYAFFLATPGADRHLSYVACSRHRQELEIHASKTEFKTKEELFNSLSQKAIKSMAIDLANQNKVELSYITKDEFIENRIDKTNELESISKALSKEKNEKVINYNTSKSLSGFVSDVISSDYGKYISIKDNNDVCHLIDAKEFGLDLAKGDNVDIEKGALESNKMIMKDNVSEVQKERTAVIEHQISM